MNEQELDQKFKDYAAKYAIETCCFHNNLSDILNLPFYLKKVVSVYIDEAESNDEIDHINSLRTESQGNNSYAIYYSFTRNKTPYNNM